MKLVTDVPHGEHPNTTFVNVVKDLFSFIKMDQCDPSAVIGTWNASHPGPDIASVDDFPPNATDFKPYVDKMWIKQGKTDNWVAMRIKHNIMQPHFTSDRDSQASSWFQSHDAVGFLCICQTCHDPVQAGWFLFSGPFTDHVFLEMCIRKGLEQQYPNEMIHFGCRPSNQKAC